MLACVCLCVCVCVFMWPRVNAYVCVCAHMHVEANSHPEVSWHSGAIHLVCKTEPLTGLALTNRVRMALYFWDCKQAPPHLAILMSSGSRAQIPCSQGRHLTKRTLKH